MDVKANVYEVKYVPRGLRNNGTAGVLARAYTPEGLVLVCLSEGYLKVDAGTGEIVRVWESGRPKSLEAIGDYNCESSMPPERIRKFLTSPGEFERTLSYVRRVLPIAEITGFARHIKDQLDDCLETLRYEIIPMKSQAGGPSYLTQVRDLALSKGRSKYALLCTRDAISIIGLESGKRFKDWPDNPALHLPEALTKHQKLLDGTNSAQVIVTSAKDYESLLKHLDGLIFVIDGRNVIIDVKKPKDIGETVSAALLPSAVPIIESRVIQAASNGGHVVSDSEGTRNATDNQPDIFGRSEDAATERIKYWTTYPCLAEKYQII